MKEIIQSKYARFFLAGLIFIVICAWFSIGFFNIDEHFQVLEFASWKMGTTPSSSMPWEFHKEVRASLLPYCVFLLCKILQLAGAYNPFTITLLLRLLIGIASWFITCLLCIYLIKDLKTEKGKKLLILMSFFIWYVPFLSVRFSSENVAGILFLYGFYILIKAPDKEKQNNIACVIAGLLFGISFFIRILLIVAIIGLIIWLIRFKKISGKKLIIIFIFFLVTVGLNLWLDSLFYGKPIYAIFNLAKIYVHHGARMMVNPWWFYIEQFVGRITPPFSLFMLFAFAIGVYKNLKNPLVWVIIPFILIHFAVRHKELRFLFSVSFIFIYVITLGIDHLLTKHYYIKWHKYIYVSFLVLNLPLLFFRTLIPGNISIGYCRYVYNHIHGNHVAFIAPGNTEDNRVWNPISSSLFILQNYNDYSFIMTGTTFYRNPEIMPVSLKSSEQLNETLNVLKPDTAYYLYKSAGQYKSPLNGYKLTEVYCFSPPWLESILIKLCDDTAAEWKIYRISKA